MKYIVYPILLFIGLVSIKMSAQTMNNDNPFFKEYTTPFQTPPFDIIKLEHYLWAFEEGIKIKRAELDLIINNPDSPTFDELEAIINAEELDVVE